MPGDAKSNNPPLRRTLRFETFNILGTLVGRYGFDKRLPYGLDLAICRALFRFENATVV